ncbi:MAG: hypothetical protein HUJ63_13015, partial [Enterococcus sp.]|nr:hypothetical protein [Enterococcus sp.]
CFNILSDMFLYCPKEACKLFNNIMIIIGEAIHAHPTMTEVLQEAALDTYGLAIHK